jgi:hypothetical protein
MEVSQDSMLQMKLVTNEDSYVKNLLGFACVLFTTSEFFGASYRHLPTEQAVLDALNVVGRQWLWKLDTPTFMACIAYSEATTLGLDGKSDAFHFSGRELCILLLWCGLQFPVPQLLGTLIYVFTGRTDYAFTGNSESYYGESGGFFAIPNIMNKWWYLLFLLFAKVNCVVSHRLDLPASRQVIIWTSIYLIAKTYDWMWLPEVVFYHDVATYAHLLIAYIVVFNYGQPFLQWCRRFRSTTIASSLYPLANVCLGLLALAALVFALKLYTFVRRNQLSNIELLMDPLLVTFTPLCAFLFLPRLQILQFIGRRVLWVYIVHELFVDIWMDGKIYGLQIYPKYESAAALVEGLLQTKSDILLGWMSYLVLAAYAIPFAVVVPFLLQEFASLAVKGVCEIWSFGKRKI